MATNRYDVIIIGAGPVGLLLANLLAGRGLSAAVCEKRREFPEESMAIGVTPASLEILRQLNLDTPFMAVGVPIRRAYVHGERRLLGSVSFETLPSDYRFILSLPRSEIVRLLAERLRAASAVDLLFATEYAASQERDNGVVVTLTNALDNRTFEMRCAYLIGCDGSSSMVRQQTSIHAPARSYNAAFLMADVVDRTTFGADAHLFFTPTGAVESFPLPGGRRRWIAQTDQYLATPADGELESMVLARTGYDLCGSDKLFQSAFRPSWMLAERYHAGRTILCGDAGHVMTPIGGQGMNTGFADAEFLAYALGKIFAGECERTWLARYTRIRQRAFRVAADRAARGMWIGTRQGTLSSGARNLFLWSLLNSPGRNWMARQFSMLTIPHGTVARLPRFSPGGES